MDSVQINLLCEKLIAYRDMLNPIDRWKRDLLADACNALDSFAKLTRKHDEALDLLYEARVFVQHAADTVDGDYGESRPNAAMTLWSNIDDLLPKRPSHDSQEGG